MLTAEQIERRFSHLGGSDMARALTGKYGGEAAVIAEKIGRSVWRGNNRTMLGDWAEPHLLDHVPGLIARNVPRVYAPWPVLEANLDGLGEGFIAEAKLVMYRGGDKLDQWGEPGTDEVPRYVTIQTHVGMMCAECEIAHVVALLADADDGPQIWTVRRDRRLCDIIEAHARRIWECVERGTVGEVDERSADMIAEAFGALERSRGKMLRVPQGDIIEVAATWFDRARQMEKFVADMRTLCRARLLALTNGAETIELADGRTVQIRTRHVKEATITRKASTATHITIMEPNESKMKGLDDGKKTEGTGYALPDYNG